MQRKSFWHCSLLISAAAGLALCLPARGQLPDGSAGNVAEFASGDQPRRQYHR